MVHCMHAMSTLILRHAISVPYLILPALRDVPLWLVPLLSFVSIYKHAGK